MTKKTTKISRSAKTRSARQPVARSKPRARAEVGPAVSPTAGTELFERIATILEQARTRVVRAVNTEMVLAYWQIGREIVEHLQEGDVRAGRGEALIEELSARLGARFGRGFSTTNLRYFRTFFLAYRDREPRIREVLDDATSAAGLGAKRAKRQIGSGVTPRQELPALPGPLEGFSPLLGWTHYQLLTKVEHDAARRFYEIEAEQAGWSAKHLERQIHTQLFARLLKSRDKAGVLDLASRGQVLERPVDAIKHPYVLDFLDLPEAHQLRERDLETAILDGLQSFLLELGKGFRSSADSGALGPVIEQAQTTSSCVAQRSRDVLAAFDHASAHVDVGGCELFGPSPVSPCTPALEPAIEADTAEVSEQALAPTLLVLGPTVLGPAVLVTQVSQRPRQLPEPAAMQAHGRLRPYGVGST